MESKSSPVPEANLYRTIFNEVGDAVIVTDLDGVIVEWNPGAERLYGYSREEALGRTPNFLFPQHPDIAADVLQSIASDADWRGELRFRRKDGSLGWVEATVVVMHNSEKEPILTVGVNRDVTRRVEVEEELTLASEILDHMVEAAHLIRRDDFTFVYVNRAFERMFGYSADEIRGRSIVTINNPENAEEVAHSIIAVLQAEGQWTGEVENVHKNGTTFWTHARVSEFRHSTYGNEPGWVSRSCTAPSNPTMEPSRCTAIPAKEPPS